MINPQSLTLKMAYEPYTPMERVIYLNANRNGYIVPFVPEFISEYTPLLVFDHGHLLIDVECRGFMTIAQARAALFVVLWGARMTLRVSCVTDLMSEDEYYSLRYPSAVRPSQSIFPD